MEADKYAAYLLYNCTAFLLTAKLKCKSIAVQGPTK